VAPCVVQAFKFKQLFRGDSVAHGPIIVKVVLSDSDEYDAQLSMEQQGLHEHLRVAGLLTPLDGPLRNFGESSDGRLLTAFVMKRMTPLREWVASWARLKKLATRTSGIVTVGVQLLEVSAH
jgi:hypothetical protein